MVPGGTAPGVGPGRHNGLPAAAYEPLLDLDPQLADAMLDMLRQEGVAAYAVPAPGRRGAYGDVQLPDRPTDRLWVDRGGAAHARAVVAARLPHLRAELEAYADGAGREMRPSVSEDEAWAQIVAAYHTAPAEDVPRWPVSEDVEDEPATYEEEDAAGPSARGRLLRRAGPDDHPEDGEEPPHTGADHYVPPPPPPLPTADALTKWAWAGLLGAPAFFLVAAVLQLPVGDWAAFLALAAFVGGFVTLVVRMRDRPPPNSGGDDGAVV